jgi:undecaprenyl-diphosphatase
MHWFQALVLGLVEGLTEFLPVSSTGHLILTSKWMGLAQTEFLKSFEIAIQLGAMLAVLGVYGRRFLTEPAVIARVLVALGPTLAVGFVLYGVIKRYWLSSHTVVLWSLLIGGVALVWFDRWHREKPEAIDDLAKIPYAKAFGIGLAQSLAVVPGVSRAAATILGGMALGLRRKTVVEFSFLLAMPTILAATALDLAKNASAFEGADWKALWIGTGVSCAVAVASIKFFLRYVQNHGFTAFGIYRILLAAVFWLTWK